MASSLSEQAAAAAGFVESTWPEAKRRALELGLERDRNRRVLLCGCGDSHHAAVSLAFAFQTWTGLQARGCSSMECARYVVPELGQHSERVLLVAISVSGTTARTLEAVELGQAIGAQTLGISSSGDNALANKTDLHFSFTLPELEHVPGLLSYLASLLMGYALARELSPSPVADEVDRMVMRVPSRLEELQPAHRELGIQAAHLASATNPTVFLGAGPAHGSAMYAAAKVIEAAGQPAWAQDVEEWAHLEYFMEPPESPVWMLRAGGRAAVRELEVIEAARAIGRDLTVVHWTGGAPSTREALAPLGLWIGPVSYADELMAKLGQQPFRGFSGGRSRAEGGGASRVRSSQRFRSLADMSPESSGN